jgi:Zn-dependent M28 family amino/carboxypeptidase
LCSGSGTATALRDRALTDQTGYQIVESLTTEIGPRLVGSPAMARAKDWAVAKMTALGFENIKVEPFKKRYWARGTESASLVAPYPLTLSIIGLGGTVPTPAKGIEAEIVVFKTYQDLLDLPPGALAGKIAVVNQRMVRTQNGSGYGPAGQPRRQGPAEAARRGALALLIRSVSTADSRLPHTGVTNYVEGVPRIPAAALGTPDADLLERLAARGPVKVRLNLASTVDENGIAWNISGDVKGSSRPEEIIVIGGHLDSWDPGTGAIDDGAGVAITAAAAHLISGLPKRPARTIRVVFWGSEESSGSSDAYLAAHKSEVEHMIIAGESDSGADRVYELELPAKGFEHPAMKAAANLLQPIGVIASRAPVEFGGSDTEGLQEAGVPVLALNQDANRYFDWHHTADDTLDKIDPQQMAQNIAAWSTLLYFLADSDVRFESKPAK